MPHPWPAWRWAVAGLSGLLLSCAAVPHTAVAPSPLPTLGPLSTAERAAVLQARTTGLTTLTALLAVSYTVGPQRGTFAMVVNYATAQGLRFTAFRDSLLQTQVLFDILLTPTTYRLHTAEASGPQTQQGAVADFARAYPAWRTFLIVGEAFFLPGLAQAGTPRTVNRAGTRLRTHLPSGVQVAWRLRPETLEITQGCFTWPPVVDTARVLVHYQDYRPVGETYLPHRVSIRDPQQGFNAEAAVTMLTLNEPLAAGVLELTP